MPIKPNSAGYLHPAELGMDFPINTPQELLAFGRALNGIKSPQKTSPILTASGETREQIEAKIRELQAQLGVLK